MRGTQRASATILATATAAVLLFAAPAAAQELYTFTVAGLVGLGGSLDANPGDELTNTSLQLNLTVVTEPRTHIGVRVGRLDLDPSEGFGSLLDAEMTYLTLGGEYRSDQGFYESGIYLALGGYQLEGTSRVDGSGRDDTTLGLAIGATGEFRLTGRLGLLIEISGHYADFDDAQFFVLGHAGLAVHF